MVLDVSMLLTLKSSLFVRGARPSSVGPLNFTKKRSSNGHFVRKQTARVVIEDLAKVTL